MKKIWKGKLRLRIERGCPYYGTDYRHLYKVLFYKWGISISLWIHHEDSQCGELSEWAVSKLHKIFPQCEIDGHVVRWNKKTYYLDDCKWLFNDKYDWEPTNNWQVMFDKKSQKFYGYSHRSILGFGIGDMLFNQSGIIGEEVKEDISSYYKNPKYRRKYILTLLKYHLKNDWSGFEDLCEDNTIGHGIKCVIPFRERGLKKIENLDEAFKAAKNFAEYVS